MPQWFAIAAPGLEPVVCRELELLGIDGTLEAGGIGFEASLERGATLAPELRTPGRLLLRMGRGHATNLQRLAQLVRSIRWDQTLHRHSRIEVHVSSRSSRLRHRDAISRKVESALKDVVRKLRPARIDGRVHQGPGQRVHLRLDQDQATFSLDAGGELLHRRGWRTSTGRAPLRENLGAAMLFLAGWTGDEALVDPFCGVGTLPIEAALLASGSPPGVGRSYSFRDWPALQRMKESPSRPRALRVPIIGADREPRALTACAENGRRAGTRHIEWRQCDVADIEPPAATGLVVTNPPYGIRLGQNVEGVYVTFGHTLRARFTGWRVLFLAPSPELARKVDRSATCLTMFPNGGVRVGAWALEL
ncbi:MAG: hypothetical protein QGG40_04950 [Myxococcota bacterium]|jgi:putative N6-adenine-specific DNA methylase|nr:hypothetical protein [Myxococcota bacterium]